MKVIITIYGRITLDSTPSPHMPCRIHDAAYDEAADEGPQKEASCFSTPAGRSPISDYYHIWTYVL